MQNVGRFGFDRAKPSSVEHIMGGNALLFPLPLRSFAISSLYLYKEMETDVVLNRANESISKDNTEFMFATLFISYYDLKTGEVQYANAGHHAAIHIKDDNTLEQFGALNNTVLGINSGCKYS